MKDAKGVAIILGRLAKDKKGEERPEETEAADGYTAAAEEVMSAVKAEDAELLASALKSFFTMCQAEG